jgi:hypothetical protein
VAEVDEDEEVMMLTSRGSDSCVLYSHTDTDRVTQEMTRRSKTVIKSDGIIFRVCV